MHLVFLIHGLFGNAGHLLSMEESILEAFGDAPPKNIKIHRAKSMSAIGTFDGISNNAHKLLEELLTCISETRATHLSIVGYSMGGLCGRYLIGLLEEANAFAQIKPVVFATFATPHLGSRYPQKTLFGFLFNTIGSRISGLSGSDLFGKSPLLEGLADPKSSSYRGLKRFPHLYLFANAINDRTVPFWTAYMSPKNPFAHISKLDLETSTEVPVLIDMRSSKISTGPPVKTPWTWKRALTTFLISLLLPIMLCILIIVMSTITLISLFKRMFSVSFRPDTNPAKSFVDRVGSTLEEVLELGEGDEPQQSNNQTHSAADSETSTDGLLKRTSEKSAASTATEQFGLPSPGFEGLVDETESNLHLRASTVKQMTSLNELHWHKFAVKMPSLNTHGEIVDRRNKSKDAKKLLNFFGKLVVQKHEDTL